MMQEQSRILMILRYLYDQTDPGHLVSSRDIKKMLEQEGIEAPASRIIASGVDQIIAAGYDNIKSNYGIRASRKKKMHQYLILLFFCDNICIFIE